MTLPTVALPDDAPAPAPVLPVASEHWPYPIWFAHRGAGHLAPENTLAAFRQGAACGFRAFECDVKLSADGIPYLMHDDTLLRTTGDEAPAGALDWNEISLLDAGSWHGRRYAGEPPASLEAVAAFCLNNAYVINIEIKPMPGDEARTGDVVALEVQALWKDAVEGGFAVWPLLSSFQPEALAAARIVAPELPRALLLERLSPDCFEVAERLDCAAVILERDLISPALVERLQKEGLRVLAYTVNDADDAQQLLEWGIDGIITDEVDQFVPD